MLIGPTGKGVGMTSFSIRITKNNLRRLVKPNLDTPNRVRQYAARWRSIFLHCAIAQRNHKVSMKNVNRVERVGQTGSLPYPLDAAFRENLANCQFALRCSEEPSCRVTTP